MKIDISKIDFGEFMVHPHLIDGETLFLVQPQHIGAKYTQQNKFFRSSVWDANGNLVSPSFCKFTNWGENPQHFPVPTSLKDTNVVEKLDGSLLIVSKWNDRIMLRTRGTVDATKLDNGHELELFKQTILPKLEKYFGPIPLPGGSTMFTYLFEWVSPNQKIVINYGDSPDWYLIGCIRHLDYSLMTQKWLNEFASEHSLKRPPCYTFPSIEALMSGVEQWKGKEGVVIYSSNDQVLHKVKSLEYLAKHRFKSEATLENTLELYLNAGRPSYQEFEKKLIEAFDYECFEMVRGHASAICDASKEVQKIVDGMNDFVKNELYRYPTRKLQAVVTIQSYGKTSRSSFVFKILDGKVLSEDDFRKLFWQVLKK